MSRPTSAPAQKEEREIVDFNEILRASVTGLQDQTYGKKNKPRNKEPSMFDILSWKEKKPDLWDFRTTKKEIITSSLANQIKYKLNKSSSHWVTETQDQFRKFQYSPDKEHPDKKKPVFIDLEGDAKHPELKIDLQPLDSFEAEQERVSHPAQFDPNFVTENQAAYGLRHLENVDEVRQYIEGQELNKMDERKKIYQQIEEKKRHEEQLRLEEEERERLAQEEAARELERKKAQEEEETIHIEKQDFSKVKSKLLQHKVKKARKLDPENEADAARLQRRKDRIKYMNETTRWLPNTAFLTYFGKPPFENYGKGNINPSVGGILYGHYMKSHNVNPHRGASAPRYKQVYEHADFSATRKPVIQPQPPRKCKDDFRLSQKELEEIKERNPLMPGRFKEQLTTIVKPDLINSLRFASEENTPEPSIDEGQSKRRKSLAEALQALNKTQRAIRQEIAKKKEASESPFAGTGRSKKAEKSIAFADEVQKGESKAIKERAQSVDTAKPTQNKVFNQGGVTQQPKEVLTQQIPKPKVSEQPKLSAESSAQKRTKFAEPTEKETFQATGPVVKQGSPARLTKIEPRVDAENRRSQSVARERDTAGSLIYFEEKLASEQQARSQTPVPRSRQSDKWEKVTQARPSVHEDDKENLPNNTLFALSEKERNPKYYKNVPPDWTKRIPHAGRKTAKHEDIKNIFHHD